jgi:hypothetical protein
MSRRISALVQLGYAPYLMHGYIYTSLKRPQRESPPSVLVAKILTEAIALYEVSDSDSEQLRESRKAIRSFLTEELRELVRYYRSRRT